MAYSGYLIKVGGAAGTALPMEFIKAETYNVEPDRKTELINRKAVTGMLHRTVAEHTSVKIEFQTRSLYNNALATLNSLITGAMTDTHERKITIQYYDPELDTYKEADCYMPDPKYSIRKAEQAALLFSPVTYTFIEY